MSCCARAMLVPAYWRFVAEGNAHLVYRYVGPPNDYFSGMVLKLPKDASAKNGDRLLYQHKFVQRIVIGGPLSPTQSPVFQPVDFSLSLRHQSSSPLSSVVSPDSAAEDTDWSGVCNSQRDITHCNVVPPFVSADSMDANGRRTRLATQDSSLSPPLKGVASTKPLRNLDQQLSDLLCDTDVEDNCTMSCVFDETSPGEVPRQSSLTHTTVSSLGLPRHVAVAPSLLPSSPRKPFRLPFRSLCSQCPKSSFDKDLDVLDNRPRPKAHSTNVQLDRLHKAYRDEKTIRVLLQDRGLVSRIHIPLQQLHLFENRHTVKLREQATTEPFLTPRTTPEGGFHLRDKTHDDCSKPNGSDKCLISRHSSCGMAVTDTTTSSYHDTPSESEPGKSFYLSYGSLPPRNRSTTSGTFTSCDSVSDMDANCPQQLHLLSLPSVKLQERTSRTVNKSCRTTTASGSAIQSSLYPCVSTSNVETTNTASTIREWLSPEDDRQSAPAYQTPFSNTVPQCFNKEIIRCSLPPDVSPVKQLVPQMSEPCNALLRSRQSDLDHSCTVGDCTSSWPSPHVDLASDEDMRSSFALLEKDLVTPPMPPEDLLSIGAPCPDATSDKPTGTKWFYITCELKPKTGLPALISCTSPSGCPQCRAMGTRCTRLACSTKDVRESDIFREGSQHLRYPSRFTLQQQLKLVKKQALERSSYRPEQFYSHLRHRDTVMNQLCSLLKQPQNNCRLFMNGIRVIWSNDQRLKQNSISTPTLPADMTTCFPLFPCCVDQTSRVSNHKNLHCFGYSSEGQQAESSTGDQETSSATPTLGQCRRHGTRTYISSRTAAATAAASAPLYASASGPASFLFGCEAVRPLETGDYNADVTSATLSFFASRSNPSFPFYKGFPFTFKKLNKPTFLHTNADHLSTLRATSLGQGFSPRPTTPTLVDYVKPELPDFPTELDIGPEDVSARQTLKPIFELFSEVILKEADLFHRLLYVHALCEGQQHLANDLLNHLITYGWLDNDDVLEPHSTLASCMNSVSALKREPHRNFSSDLPTVSSSNISREHGSSDSVEKIPVPPVHTAARDDNSLCNQATKVVDTAAIDSYLMSDVYAIPALEEFLEGLESEMVASENWFSRTADEETSESEDPEIILARRIQLWHYNRGLELLKLLQEYQRTSRELAINAAALRKSVVHWIYRFLIGRTFLDCSIMLNLAVSSGEPPDVETVLEPRFIKLCEIPFTAFTEKPTQLSRPAPSDDDGILSIFERLRAPILSNAAFWNTKKQPHCQGRVRTHAKDYEWPPFLSLIKTLHPSPDNASDSLPAQLQGNERSFAVTDPRPTSPALCVWYRVSVVDLDLKQASKIPQWAQQLDDILQAQTMTTEPSLKFLTPSVPLA